jgi:hypothetical protein
MNAIPFFSNDQPGIYLIRAGRRLAFRNSLIEALRCAYEAALSGQSPKSIIGIGINEQLDAGDILNGWRELGLPLDSIYRAAPPAKQVKDGGEC